MKNHWIADDTGLLSLAVGSEAHLACFATPFAFALRKILPYILPALLVRIHFYSYFKELTGAAEVTEDVAPGSRLGDLLEALFLRFPKLAPMRKSTLVAVGVDYQSAEYILGEGDEVSLFPPVQGG